MIKEMPLVVFTGSLLDAFVKLSLIMIIIRFNNIYKSKKFWLSIIFLSLYVCFSYLITDSVIRLIFLFVITIICALFIRGFKKNKILQTTIVTFFVWLIMVLVDIVFNILVTGYFKST